MNKKDTICADQEVFKQISSGSPIHQFYDLTYLRGWSE